MSLFDFAKSTFLLGNQGPQLSFSKGDLVSLPSNTCFWTINEGKNKLTNERVTVFSFDPNKQRQLLPLARNAIKRFRTIKHPLLPKYIDGAETDSIIIFGTEYLTPLSSQLNGHKTNDDFICLGLYKIASIIKFLNTDCQLIHGNIRVSSIYTTKAGEWKLCGFDVLSGLKEPNAPITQFASLIPNSMKYAPPEIQKSSWASIGRFKRLPSFNFVSHPLGSVDTWQFGCLIHEIFNGNFERSEDLGPRGTIPQNLYSMYKTFINPNPKARDQLAELLHTASQSQGYFDNEIIRTSSFLEQWSIKEGQEKDFFIKKLHTSLESFPVEFSQNKILPELINALEFGGAGAKSLVPILKIGSKLEQEDFDRLITPIVIKLFSSPDRAIRVALCENLFQIIDHLSSKVCDQIFPNLATGFNDTSPPIREHTLKTILVIISKLNERIINNELLRYLAKLQSDEEPGIRTNTTICIGKIAKYLSDGTKKKVFVAAFTRSLQDPFPPSRNAGLLAFSATIDSYDKEDISQKVIPAISLLLIDTELSIRTQALKSIELCIKNIEKLTEKMPVTSSKPDTKRRNSFSSSSTDQPTGEGLMGWAISAVKDKISTSMSQSNNTDPSPSSAIPTMLKTNSTPAKPSSINNGLSSTPISNLNANTNSNLKKPPAPTTFVQPVKITSTNLQMKHSAGGGEGWGSDRGGGDGWGENWSEGEDSDSGNPPSFQTKQPTRTSHHQNSTFAAKPVSVAAVQPPPVQQWVGGWGDNEEEPKVALANSHTEVWKDDDGWGGGGGVSSPIEKWGESFVDPLNKSDEWGDSSVSQQQQKVGGDDRKKRMDDLREKRKNAKLGAKKI